MPRRAPLPVVVTLILLTGAGVFFARHRVLLKLRSAQPQPPADVGQVHDLHPATEADAPGVPADLLRLRAEHQRLQREVAAADDRIRNLTHPPEFQPGTHPLHAAQAAMIEELRRISSGPDFEAARNLGQALAGYLAKSNGQLPSSIETVLADAATGTPAPTPADPESAPLRSFELIELPARDAARWKQRWVARSDEMPLASGMLARLFIRGDGTVIVGTVDNAGEWADWLKSQQARAQVAEPSE